MSRPSLLLISEYRKFVYENYRESGSSFGGEFGQIVLVF